MTLKHSTGIIPKLLAALEVQKMIGYKMRLLFICLLSLFPVLAFATGTASKAKVDNSRCQVTPAISQNRYDYPGREDIVSSNNLALPAGKSVYAKGQKVYIRGRVLDKNCVPVSDAIVEIWHVNPNGKPVNSSLGDRMSPYPDFVGSGRAITNNLGDFSFVTLFPGIEKADSAPYIHFRVTCDGFKTVTSGMFFSGDNRNSSDKALGKIADDQRELLLAKIYPIDNSNDIEAEWNIVIDGVNQFRKY